MSDTPFGNLDQFEKLMKVVNLVADTNLKAKQDRWEVPKVLISGMTAGAALFAAGAAFTKLLG